MHIRYIYVKPSFRCFKMWIGSNVPKAKWSVFVLQTQFYSYIRQWGLEISYLLYLFINMLCQIVIPKLSQSCLIWALQVYTSRGMLESCLGLDVVSFGQVLRFPPSRTTGQSQISLDRKRDDNTNSITAVTFHNCLTFENVWTSTAVHFINATDLRPR